MEFKEDIEHFLNYDGDIIVEQNGSISPISMNGKFQLKNDRLIIKAKAHHLIRGCDFKYNSISTRFNAFFWFEENGFEERFVLELIPYIQIDDFYSTERNPNLEKDEFEIEIDDYFIELDKFLKARYLKNKLEENLTQNNLKTNKIKV